ncbi:transporter substrate-binding domain-containing protein [Pseudochrobactrum kiredjianiae]|uniref:Transporter substrate-binding domain-containing protein n=1 Tax=Pseudochrobactrum kiredjianiae TaxID=386305 RepID=A0ABW3V026_9HYPH|nr:transporter substrate-binding domain-containing protein [Pseudochrobactrum kiredjianiae]MDM7853253.1 transporter substrate-binding domain-containing protein [Pseudochrobactrum kiredjianiae]
MPKEITIATEGAYAPWNFTTPDGKLVGYEVELATELCSRMKVKCNIVAQDWDGILPGLNAGKFDAIMASMGKTAEREKVALFSTPYTAAPNAFMTLAGNSVANSIADTNAYNITKNEQASLGALKTIGETLKGKTVGVQRGSSAALFANEYLKDYVTIREYKTFQEQNLDLAAGRVDVVIANITVLTPVIKDGTIAGATLVGPTFQGGALGSGTIHVAMRKPDTALAEAFNAAIDSVNNDGFNKALSVKWFDADITPK